MTVFQTTFLKTSCQRSWVWVNAGSYLNDCLIQIRCFLYGWDNGSSKRYVKIRIPWTNSACLQGYYCHFIQFFTLQRCLYNKVTYITPRTHSPVTGAFYIVRSDNTDFIVFDLRTVTTVTFPSHIWLRFHITLFVIPPVMVQFETSHLPSCLPLSTWCTTLLTDIITQLYGCQIYFSVTGNFWST